MDKVIIHNLKVQGILGIHEWERVTTRKIVINATLFTDTRAAAKSDDIADCVNYSEMAKKLRAHAEHAARKTVEALANDLAEICLQEPQVLQVIIRVDKPGAVPETENVGVEIERSAAQG
jgi:FolB domain-containing protein